MLNLPIKILDKIVVDDAVTEQITFSNIDTLVAQWDALAHVTSRHLVLIINARTVDVSDSITNFLRFNESAAMDYRYQRLSGVDAAASAGRTDGANAINLPPICGSNNVGAYGGSMVLIPHAFNTTNHKVVLALGGSSEFTVEAVAARWAQAAAITSVTILEGVGDDYVAGSMFLLGVVDERYLVEEIEDAAADFSPVFNNIPQGEGDLAVVGFARSDRAAVEDEVLHTINDDNTAANYPVQELLAANGATGAANPNQEISMVSGDNATALVFGALVAVYSQYTKQNQPHFLSQSGYHEGTGPNGHVRVMSGRRDNVEPINKLALSPNTGTDFKAGALFSLYRIPKRLIDRQVLTVATATVTFADIAQYYEALILHVYARTDKADDNDGVMYTINGDGVAANYDYQSLIGEGAVVSAARDPALNYLMGIIGNTQGVGEYGGGTALFISYNRTDGHKHIMVDEGRTENRVLLRSCRWESNSAISSIVLTPQTGPNFLPGSIFELEGILRKEGLPASEGMRWG